MATTTTTTAARFQVGELVVIDPLADAKGTYHGVVFRVAEKARTYLRLQMVTRNGAAADPQEPLVKCPATYVLPAADAPTVTAPPRSLTVGEVVTVKPFSGWTAPADTRWVVIGMSATGYHIAKLGGGDNKVWKGISALALTPVPCVL